MKNEIKEFRDVIAKKMFEKDYELAERKLMRSFEDKIQDLQESHRMDRNELNNKITKLKADVSLTNIPSNVRNFLIDHVYSEWATQGNRMRELERQNEEFRENQTHMTQKLNEALKILDID